MLSLSEEKQDTGRENLKTLYHIAHFGLLSDGEDLHITYTFLTFICLPTIKDTAKIRDSAWGAGGAGSMHCASCGMSP